MRLIPASFAILACAAMLAGCARMGAATTGPTLASTSASSPATTTASALTSSDVLAFIDPNVASKLSDGEKSEAASAQFYALQFGRPGAPRQWQGNAGASGRVLVGPYIRVNNLDCREFSHTVTSAGTTYARAGTACREPDGHWSVVNLS